MTPAERIEAERRRQIDVEGWTPQHDDQHDNGELLRAAMCYFAAAKGTLPLQEGGIPFGWPWEPQSWKPKDRERNLLRAGALALAEHQRLKRRGGFIGHVDHKLRLIADELGKVPALS